MHTTHTDIMNTPPPSPVSQAEPASPASPVSSIDTGSPIPAMAMCVYYEAETKDDEEHKDQEMKEIGGYTRLYLDDVLSAFRLNIKPYLSPKNTLAVGRKLYIGFKKVPTIIWFCYDQQQRIFVYTTRDEYKYYLKKLREHCRYGQLINPHIVDLKLDGINLYALCFEYGNNKMKCIVDMLSLIATDINGNKLPIKNNIYCFQIRANAEMSLEYITH